MARVLRRVAVTAIEPDSVQIMWGDGPPGTIEVTTGDRVTSLVQAGGPGGCVLGGLTPDTEYRITVRGRRGALRRLRARTLNPPPGQALSRVATVSDLHLGSLEHGYFRTMVDRSGHDDPPPVRCARAALTEASAWGARHLVVKGDVTHDGWREQWETYGELVAATPDTVEVTTVPGNHDVTRRREVDAHAGIGLAGLKGGDLHVVDLSGLRVVAADSALDTRSRGTVRRVRSDLLDAVREAPLGVLVCLHHPLERLPFPTRYPVGVRWPESTRFLTDLARANRRTLVTSGHTHRNRRARSGPLPRTEVGSCKDWPGVWAGYEAYEGGVRQVVRRIMAPDALGWVEYTRWAVAGVWRWYAPGRMADRCFSVRWD